MHRLDAIRSSHGEETADTALRCVANVLSTGFRDSDVVALLSDDTFIVLCGSAPSETLATRISGNVDVATRGLPVRVAVSVASARATREPISDQVAGLDWTLRRAMIDDVYRAAGLSASIAR